MDKKYSSFLVFASSLFLVVVLSIYFVLASLAVTNVHFESNVTEVYDEGVFSINWTNATEDSNFTIYVYVNSTTAFVYADTNSSGFINSSATGAVFT